ncbi:hypothetical protein [Arboricoccus pini]|nr:hypothetical protein [Arboricoccus pini]
MPCDTSGTNAGRLFFDKNGKEIATATHFADLDNTVHLATRNFHLIE